MKKSLFLYSGVARYWRVVGIGLLLILWQQVMAEPLHLTITSYTATIDGKTAQRYRIEQANGTWGFTGVKGQWFDVILHNAIAEPTVVHWHGLILPNDQDGVPGVTQTLIQPGQNYHYRFKLNQAGTYWMHSHYQFQLQQGLAAPFIITDPNDPYAKIPSVIMMLSDFSTQAPDALWSKLRSKMSPSDGMTMMGNMQNEEKMMPSKMKSDLNDVRYDAYLTNDRTLINPDIKRFAPGTTVRLRIINAAASSNFFIHTGKLKGTAIAVDGEPIQPLKDETFQLAMGQRIDILVTLPTDKEMYPILAQAEGTAQQTGLILTSSSASIPTFSETTSTTAGALTMDQEMQLKPLHPLIIKPITRQLTLNLQGDMQQYVWKINGQVWPDIIPLRVKQGDRIEMVFRNENNMSHPLHLHGHVFEVTEINGKPLQGALRDTVLIPANGSVKIQFDADNPGAWMLHCHVLYHAEGGMMTLVNYKASQKTNSSSSR